MAAAIHDGRSGALLSRLTEAEPATLHVELRKRDAADEIVAQQDCVIDAGSQARGRGTHWSVRDRLQR